MSRSKRLSPVMRSAMVEIFKTGGEAHCRGGGWWNDRTGRQMFHSTNPSVTGPVTTNTIYALEQRGVLRGDTSGGRFVPRHRRTRVLTEMGRAAAQALVEAS